jgi:acyl carrier protein
VKDRLADIFRDVFNVPPERCVPSLSMKDVKDWDSVNHITLVLSLECVFGVEFSPEEISELASVGQIEAMLAKHGVR